MFGHIEYSFHDCHICMCVCVCFIFSYEMNNLLHHLKLKVVNELNLNLVSIMIDKCEKFLLGISDSVYLKLTVTLSFFGHFVYSCFIQYQHWCLHFSDIFWRIFVFVISYIHLYRVISAILYAYIDIILQWFWLDNTLPFKIVLPFLFRKIYMITLS